MITRDEASRIEQLYASLSEEELAQLYDRRGDLTPEAQEALGAEFRSRRITPPEAESEPVTAPVESDDSVMSLWEFRDSLQATQALSVLEGAEIAARLMPGDVRDRGDGSSLVLWRLVIPKADEVRSVELLRKHCGLFPLPESPDARYNVPDEGVELITVGAFDDAGDMALAQSALTATGILFTTTQEQGETGPVWILGVTETDIENAGNVIEQAFQAGGEPTSEPVD